MQVRAASGAGASSRPARTVRRFRRGAVVVGAALLAACGVETVESPDAPGAGPTTARSGEEGERTGSVSSALVASYLLGGQRLEVKDLGEINPTSARIAACGDRVVYKTNDNGTLWVRTDASTPGNWKEVVAGSKGVRIACDHSHFYSLDASNQLWVARTTPSGQLFEPKEGSVWSRVANKTTLALPANLASLPASAVDIQSGAGNLYALAQLGGGKSALYASPLSDLLHASPQGGPTAWIQLANNLGSKIATGAGSTGLVVPENRAFGMNPDGTLYMNDTMLDGQNFWTKFPNGGVVLRTISAESANVLYGIGTVGADEWPHFFEYRFTEEDCSDGIDGDRNGLTDGDDPVCRDRLAKNFCTLTEDGDYCIDRVRSGLENALVKCVGGKATVKAGVCKHGAAPGLDVIAAPANPEPPNTGHYCSIVNEIDHTWEFAFVGDDPCASLLLKPGAKIARAGQYSLVGTNDLLARCTDGGVTLTGTGIQPLSKAKTALGHGGNACVITVSPRRMPVFNAPFPTNSWQPNGIPGQTQRGYAVGHVFDHSQSCVANDPLCPCAGSACFFDVGTFGAGVGVFSDIDNKGRGSLSSDQSSYDFMLTEGTPLRSLANGTVIAEGSRAREIVNIGSFGTPRQNEILVRYDVGTNERYAETFVAYYAHAMQRLVESEQVVQAGQIIGYVGMTGQATDPHVHFGLFRLTNINAMTTAEPWLGRRVELKSDLSRDTGRNAIADLGAADPYGWRAGGIDPWGHVFARAATGQGSIGLGTWSPTMWSSAAETPPF